MRRNREPLTSFLRGSRGLSRYGRAHALVGVMTAKWVLKRRSRFDSNDVVIRRVPGLDPKIARSLVGEYLSAWENPGYEGHSAFAREMVRRHPALHDRVVKYWEGW